MGEFLGANEILNRKHGHKTKSLVTACTAHLLISASLCSPYCLIFSRQKKHIWDPWTDPQRDQRTDRKTLWRKSCLDLKIVNKRNQNFAKVSKTETQILDMWYRPSSVPFMTSWLHDTFKIKRSRVGWGNSVQKQHFCWHFWDCFLDFLKNRNIIDLTCSKWIRLQKLSMVKLSGGPRAPIFIYFLSYPNYPLQGQFSSLWGFLKNKGPRGPKISEIRLSQPQKVGIHFLDESKVGWDKKVW